MTRHDDTVYLRHMLSHARTALKMKQGKSEADLGGDQMFRYALLHLICILGEAANCVSPEGRKKYRQVPWRAIISMRNILIHGYDSVDLELLWETVATDLPRLIETLTEVIDGPECE